MVQSLPITTARAKLGALAQRAHRFKEYFILESDGIPLAGIMDIDEFEDYLELQNPAVNAKIAEGRQQLLHGEGRPLEELIGSFRKEKEESKTPSL